MAFIYGLVLSLIFSAADWAVVACQRKSLKYVTKPLVMVVMLFWLLITTGYTGFTLIFAFGLFFSLLGDVWLMLPRRFFIAGLFSFLVAHLCYIVGMNQTPFPFSLSSILVGITLIVAALLIIIKIKFGLMNMIGTLRMRLPMVIYGIVLTGMLMSAGSTLFRPEWMKLAAIVLFIGGIFFFASDSLLGFDRFVKPFRNARLIVRITYHLGQILIISGAILQYAYSMGSSLF